MIRFLCALAAFALVLLAAKCAEAAPGECLHSARAVWSAHPSSWATWHDVNGKRCWMIGKRKEVMHHVRTVRSSSLHETKPRLAAPSPAGAKCDRECQQLFDQYRIWLWYGSGQ